MKGRHHSSHPVAAARRATRRRLAGDEEAGFTLIELVIVVAILPIVVGGIAIALISVINLQGSVSNRVGNSNDALVASSNFNRDVQSAIDMTTQGTPGCGTATQNQLLGLEWGANTAANGGYQTVVSYISSPSNPPTIPPTYILLRQECTSGQSTTNYTTRTLSSNLGSSPTVTIYGNSTAANTFPIVTPLFSQQWETSQSVTKVAVNVDEPGPKNLTGNDYSYQLVGLPGQGVSQGSATTTTIPTTGNECEFATSGSGTYANQLCFIDFTGLDNPPITYSASNPNQCQQMSGPVGNTPYTVSFCISVVPNQYNAPAGCGGLPSPLMPVTDFPIPTYYFPTGGFNSEAFLGNNGFYTGLSGNPALYQDQTTNGSRTHASDGSNSGCEYQMSTIYITNFQVLDAAGQQASGWTLVTGDAESTDGQANPYIGEWTVYQNLSGLNWSVLDNNGPTDPYGNACYDSQDTIGGQNVGFLQYKANAALAAGQTIPNTDKGSLPAAGATFPQTGTTNVLCESDQRLNKTGTLMVGAQQPTAGSQSIKVTMNGLGWGQAIFLGVLL